MISLAYGCLKNTPGLYVISPTRVPTLFIPPYKSSSPPATPAALVSVTPTENTLPEYEALDVFTKRMHSIPNYQQYDPAFGGLPSPENGVPGIMYCVPAAVSNSLMWLDDNGFENIVKQESSDRKFDQFQLILELSKPEYLNTNVEIGTSHANILEGIERFLGERGYEYKFLGNQGWMPVPEKYNQGELVSLEWMKEGLQDCGSVWFSIGYYEYNPDYDIYKLERSHMVTMVGFGFDGNGVNKNALIVHDPLQKDRGEPENVFLIAEEISSGVMEGSALGLPRPAQGFYRLEGMVSGGDEIAILSSAIVLKLPGVCPD